MNTAKKLDPEQIILAEVEPQKKEESSDIPAWKKKKQDRQKLLRALRAKSFSETIHGVIRREIKKGEITDD